MRKKSSILVGMIVSLMMVAPLSNSEAATSYTVKNGDSLYKISKGYSVDISSLKTTNNLSGSNIYPGQKLIIPDNNSWVYTVKNGDSLYNIGKRCGVSYTKLIQYNNLKSSIIYPGQKINIPSSSTTYAPTVADRGSVDRPRETTTTNSSSVSAGELDLLSRLISAEAQGESYLAQVAVGAVVLNRVKSAQFANTISGVIYDKTDGHYQFTPVLNGFIKNAATDSARRAAQEALAGKDPTYGALYFYDNTVRNTWLTSKPVATKIGAFTFAY